MKRFKVSSLSVLFCAVFFSAGASGPTYREARKSNAIQPKVGKGLVLIYWKPVFGKTVAHRVYANDQLLLSNMRSGNFYTYDAPPGNLRLASTSGTGNTGVDFALNGWFSLLDRKKEMAVLDITPMQTYYVLMWRGFSREYMKVVSPEEGEVGIQECNWLNPPIT